MAGDEATILVLDALDKIGYPGEEAGTGDIFQCLILLANALGSIGEGQSANGDTLQRLANLVQNLGQLTDGSSPSGSALARLADLENKLGAINPSSGGTDTLFHYLYAAQSYLNGAQAIPGLGQQGDAANAAGTANAKLAHIINYLVNTIYAYETGTIHPALGSTGDAASPSGSVLARLADLEAKIGAINPSSGDLTTLFKGLKLIADYVDTLGTKVGANTDTAGTTTLFARLTQIAGYTDQVEGYVDTLETALGQPTDAASPSGSVHAKIGDLKNTVNTVPQKSLGPNGTGGSLTTSSTSWVTAFSYSGPGKLICLAFTTANNFSSIRITVDGNVFITFTPNPAQGHTYTYVPTAHFYMPTYTYGAVAQWDFTIGSGQGNSSGSPKNAEIDFKSSIIIEISAPGNSNNCTLYWLVEV